MSSLPSLPGLIARPPTSDVRLATRRACRRSTTRLAGAHWPTARLGPAALLAAAALAHSLFCRRRAPRCCARVRVASVDRGRARPLG
eukprot:scaffold1188_cov124-Isochrysis_galbana.AAC.2